MESKPSGARARGGITGAGVAYTLALIARE